MMVWRFSSPEDWVKESMMAVVASMEGPIKWDGDFARKNWSVMPVRLREAFQMHMKDSRLGVVSDLKNLDQEFCRLANLDLGLMMYKLEEVAFSGPSNRV
ncbi:hypothetical protein [Actinomadura sp. K4S16]|uniref:hypothetical protein n=1 Tax=Actinomadura sp. K4S16 TaxID=1316147 RepID=UPI0011EF6084|nr:hypothetical protein [Actinomadura sp. K4S16]